MKIYFKLLKTFFHFLGTRNWYQGIDKPNFYEWIYKWRISPQTAWELANGIVLDKWKAMPPKEKEIEDFSEIPF